MNQSNFQNPELQTKKWSKFTMIITIITIIFLLFVVYKKFDNITELIGGTTMTWENEWLQIWQQISVEWTIMANWDLINYTHQLETLSSGIFGLKSKSIDLNQYTWDILIEWNIEKEMSGMYIIDVISVIWDMAILTWEELWDIEPDWVYIERAWIHFPQSFLDNYTLENKWENNAVLLKRTSNWQEIKINYFACKKWDPNDDCAQLKKNFSSMIERKITTNNNDEIIKLIDVNSWFVTNDLFGYFINDIPAQEVTDLSNYFVIPNKTYVKDYILDVVPNICVDWLTKLEEIESNNLLLENNKITLKVTGKVNSGNAECKITLDPSLPTLWTKFSFYYPDSTNTDSYTEDEIADIEDADTENTDTTSTIINPLTKDPSVTQFPINLEKSLEFVSNSRWFKMTFPSSNIAYESTNTSTNLDINWVNCYVQTNVIVYREKDNININPSIKIYECRIKSTAEIPSSYLRIDLDDWRSHLVEVFDPSRIDFANNIVIETL